MDNLPTFLADVNNGRWDSVLSQLSKTKLPTPILEDVNEHVILELIELRETDAAKSLLRQAPTLQSMKLESAERFVRLEKLCNKTYFDAQEELYGETRRDKRRARLAQQLSKHLTTAPPSRLLAIIGQALQWQHQQNLLPAGTPYDLLQGAPRITVRDEIEAPPTVLDRTIRFGKKSHPESLAFSPDGLMLVTGSVDGFIEIWDPETGRLKKDLPYQGKEQFMMHDNASPVVSLAFSSYSAGGGRGELLLVSGSGDGKIKVWRVATGQCLRKYEAAHSEGVTSVMFSPNDGGGQILSASYDGMVRCHGIKSGKLLKEFRGHTSYVNRAIYSADGSRVISVSSDSTVKVWDAKSCDCLATFSPPKPDDDDGGALLEGRGGGGQAAEDVPVMSVSLDPVNTDHIVVTIRGSRVYYMTMSGKVVKTVKLKSGYFSKKNSPASDFVSCTTSPKGEWLYCLSESGVLYCFEVESGRLEKELEVGDGEGIGVVHHPHRNVVAVASGDGLLKTFSA